MLELIEVTKQYKSNKAVNGISFQLHKGDSLGLIGPNGAGKSTTISMIATLVKPESGDILFEGRSILKNPNFMRSKLGYVPQEIALYEKLTGIDNLKFFGKAYGLKKSELRSAIDEVKEMIGFGEEQLRQKVSTYSGGMKRRLNIGVALLHKPSMVVMDEPTVGIDIVSRDQILETIKNINRSGVTILYTGHYLAEIETICNKICILHKGNIVAFGDKEELLLKSGNLNSLEQLYLNTVAK